MGTCHKAKNPNFRTRLTHDFGQKFPNFFKVNLGWRLCKIDILLSKKLLIKVEHCQTFVRAILPKNRGARNFKFLPKS